MTARIDEATQWQDVSGAPIVNGSIFIGVQNADPVANPIPIFSDRELTIPLANPQLTDANGRAVNKIYIPGNYSVQVNDSAAVQQFQDLDAGLPENLSQTILINVIGATTITADTSPPITQYVDNALYMFTAVGPNAFGGTTINIEGLGAKSIRKNFNEELEDSDFVTNQSVVLVFNLTTDDFQWVNQKLLVDLLNPVGLIFGFIGLVAPTGWILADGGTIGNPASGATTRANNDTEPLFTLFWNSMGDAQAPVSGGRGASAALDFAANKNITISNLMSGAALVGTGGVQPAIHGTNGGFEDHTLTIAEMPSHDHTGDQLDGTTVNFQGAAVPVSPAINIAGVTDLTGGGGAHNNMPPFVSSSFIIKL